jgi:hypothetical protein
MPRLGHGEQDNVLRARGWSEHTIENRLQQYQPKGFEESDGSQQKNSGQELQQEGQHVADKPDYLPHGTPARRKPSSVAAGKKDERRKTLFYLTRTQGE